MSDETITVAFFLMGCFLPFGWIALAAVVSLFSQMWLAVVMFLVGQYVRKMFMHKTGG